MRVSVSSHLGRYQDFFEEFNYGGWKQFPVLSKTWSLMGHDNHSVPVDAKIMVSRNCPIIGEQIAVNCVA